ncbi:MAG: hypothetical protein ACI849_001416, partial [Patiriisocius sp.]
QKPSSKVFEAFLFSQEKERMAMQITKIYFIVKKFTYSWFEKLKSTYKKPRYCYLCSSLRKTHYEDFIQLA